MEEYNIWKKIFESDDDITLEALVELVVKNQDARELVMDNLLNYKNQPKQLVKVNINIDKELSDFPTEKILSKVSDDLIKQMNE